MGKLATSDTASSDLQTEIQQLKSQVSGTTVILQNRVKSPLVITQKIRSNQTNIEPIEDHWRCCVFLLLDLQRQLAANEEKCQNLEDDKEKLVGLVIDFEINIFNKCPCLIHSKYFVQTFLYGLKYKENLTCIKWVCQN